jgi:hypothetical protein
MTIVNDDSSIVSKWSSKLIDDARVIIYDLKMFIIQATGYCQVTKLIFISDLKDLTGLRKCICEESLETILLILDIFCCCSTNS